MTEAEYPLLEFLHLASLVQGPCFPLTIPTWCCDHPDREGAGGQCLPLVSPRTWSASGPEPVKVPQQRDLLPAPHGRGECPSPMNPVIIFQLHEDPTITLVVRVQIPLCDLPTNLGPTCKILGEEKEE